ncbi:predicted protein [Naegleria gruberi]|uniref:Predicted protein n=1 Tax=Naegleria gruberi TaxID=5762 RepID=D2VNM4_NAEGR|nr:uncharacterized protein NAEGRDRAFT_70550 [Naegleria gruberi]EFC41529.1 predicted protein [Naegleria gruberi]|eukprot:XP_002674273.1 predicted protein [Naegleria gruberi strain NEG-M]
MNCAKVEFWNKLVSSTITINKPASDVFEYITKREHYPMGMVVKWEPLGEGLELEQVFAKRLVSDPNLAYASHLQMLPFKVSILTEDNVMNAKLWKWQVSSPQQKGHFVFGWKGVMGWKYFPLFTGEHTFEVIEESEKSCKLIHSERFGGLLGHLFMLYLKLSSFCNHFSEFNSIVKKRLE